MTRLERLGRGAIRGAKQGQKRPFEMVMVLVGQIADVQCSFSHGISSGRNALPMLEQRK